MENAEKKQKNEMVCKSNALIDASFKLSLSEFRLLNLIFAQMTNDKDLVKELWFDNEFKVTALEYSQAYDVNISTAYESLQEASKHLFQRYFRYESNNQLAKNLFEVVESRWVSQIRYSKQGGYVVVVLTKDVTDLVGFLQDRFTQYNLHDVTLFTSIYAKRLYEIIVRWRNAGQKTPRIEVDELRRKLGIETDQYKQMNNFKKIVLDTAINQINEHSDIVASYDQIKSGRYIVAFIFKFRQKKVINGKSNKIETNRDPQTIDAFSGLTDVEKKAITARADSHIKKNNITDPKHKANIKNKAIQEKWGVADQPPAQLLQELKMPELDTVEEDLKSKMLSKFLNK